MSGSDARAAGDPVVELRDVTHRYGATLALSDCRLAIAKGEVHGLVGENGSGKSTVVKLLSGVMAPGGGELRIDGESVRFRSPGDAQRRGIATVFQETLIAEECSAVENVFMGMDGLFRRGRGRNAERKAAEESLERLGVSTAMLRRQPAHLSLAERQILTIARALARDWRLLILDEATSALDIATRDRLFAAIDEFKSEGRSVLFVSHRMDELQILIDRATVQRSGKTVATLDRSEASTDRLLSLMVGQSTEEVATLVRSAPSGSRQEVVLSCRQIQLKPDSAPFDLEIHRGEILGLAALEGHGAPELVATIARLHKPVAGSIVAHGGGEAGDHEIRSFRDANRQGIAYVPAKRQSEGLFPSLSVGDNLSISTLRRHARAGIFRRAEVDRLVQQQLSQLAVKPQDPSVPVSALSGGNAQKVLIGRWLAADPWLLLLNDPLRGVDLGTKREFYRRLVEMADAGITVLLLSTEIEELLTVSDRIAVCREFSLGAVLTKGERSYEGVLREMFGQAADEAPAVSVGPVGSGT